MEPRPPLDGLRVLYLCDRLGGRGGSDRHLLLVVAAAVAAGARVSVACGGRSGAVELGGDVALTRIRGLDARSRSTARLAGLDDLLAKSDLVHIQNVMNPAALAAAVATGRAVATVQDHRLLCPGPGKTLPDGSRCRVAMADAVCRACLTDDGYRERMLALTAERRDALRGARLVVLSRYMAGELAAVELAGAAVIPPWVEVGEPRAAPGDAFLVAGRLVEHKGVRDAWWAWRAAATPLGLRVAGTGPLAASMEGAELLGWLGPQALRSELRRARALLFTSRWQEPFGIVGVEALAEGTPVIVVPGGGTDEWSGEGCVKVERAALVGAVRSLAMDSDGALRLGRAGQAAVGRIFARSELEPRLWRLYAEVAARGR